MQSNHSTYSAGKSGNSCRTPQSTPAVVARYRAEIRRILSMPPKAGRYWVRAPRTLREFLLILEGLAPAEIARIGGLNWASLPHRQQRAVIRAYRRLYRSVVQNRALPEAAANRHLAVGRETTL